ncbi:MAG: glycoside hydrolase [Eubacteriales bacterium]|nr:glycoside hydrolase [Eubacteriales bacterium]
MKNSEKTKSDKCFSEGFAQPGALYRPAPFWSWNDSLDKDELERQIGEMAEKGWGSYFMHSRVGLVTGYLSDEWMKLIKACVAKATETGTYAWLYDEDKWPSGFAGGEVPEADEAFRSRALVLLRDDEITENDIVLHRAGVKDESGRNLICRRISPLGDVWFNGASYVDLMNPEAVRRFFESTHEKYKKECGQYFGKEIPGIFTDEPCYLMNSRYKMPVLPWSDYLPEFFVKTKGYKLEDRILEDLFFDKRDGTHRKTRFDFFESATGLFIESFTKPYYKWCEENNLIMTGHFMAEDSLASQINWIGAAMPHYEFMHWPGIDKLGRHIKQLVTVKQVTSVADQLGKERSFCEVFGCVGQHVSFFHRKWIADWQAALGISFVNYHLSLYSMRGERKRDYPANLFYQQPWWREEKGYADYTARLCYAVSTGKRETEILMIHPISSAWCEFSPARRAVAPYDADFSELSLELEANKLDFHYGDEIIMERHAAVKNGRIVIGDHSYSAVVVPPACNLKRSTADLLASFINEAGPGRVIFVKKMPELVDGQPLENGIEGGLFSGCSVTASIKAAIDELDMIFAGRITITDTKTGMNAARLFCHSRKTDGGRLVFIANTDKNKSYETAVQLPGASSIQVMDLMTGKHYSLKWFNEDTHEIRARFYPAGSLMLYLPDEEDETAEIPPCVPAFLGSGVSFASVTCGYGYGTKLIANAVNWKTTICEENVLPLNRLTLFIDGKPVAENGIAARVLHDHFYPAKDGAGFRAEYVFEVLEAGEPENENLFAAIELAENLDRIIFNGREVAPLKKRGEKGAFDSEKSWKDPSFTRVPLDGLLVKGENRLVLEGKKVNNITGPNCHRRVPDFKSHEPTEAEAVYIVGKFRVTDLDRENFVLDRASGEICRHDLTASGYPFYAGRAEFCAEIFCTPEMPDAGGEIYLALSRVTAADITVYINDKAAGTGYWEPYMFNAKGLLKKGVNKIRIEAATTLYNLMGPAYISGILESESVSPGTFIDKNRFADKYELMPFGIGDAVLVSI